jgi:secernin
VCDSLVALPAVTGGPTLFGKNSDRPPEEVQELEFHPTSESVGVRKCTHIMVAPEPDEVFAVLGHRPRWGWGFEHGVNEAGVAIGNHRITTIHDPRPYPDALTGMDLVRLTLERAPSAAAGVAVLTELLEQYRQGGSCFDPATHSRKPYWSSFLIADSADAWVVDTSGATWAAEQIVGSRSVSNRPSIASFDQRYRHPDAPVEALVDPRLAVTRAALRRPVLERQFVNRHHIQDALTSHQHSSGHDTDRSIGWSVCMHGEGTSGSQQTTASMIAELSPNRVPRVWVSEANPCVRSHREVVFGPQSLRV